MQNHVIDTVVLREDKLS